MLGNLKMFNLNLGFKSHKMPLLNGIKLIYHISISNITKILNSKIINLKNKILYLSNNHLNQLVLLWGLLLYKIQKFTIKYIDGAAVDKVLNNLFVMEVIKELHLNHINSL